MKRFFPVLLAFVLVGPLFGGTAEALINRIWVTVNLNGQPLPGATLYVEHAGGSIWQAAGTSLPNGFIRSGYISPGTYYVKVQKAIPVTGTSYQQVAAWTYSANGGELVVGHGNYNLGVVNATCSVYYPMISLNVQYNGRPLPNATLYVQPAGQSQYYPAGWSAVGSSDSNGNVSALVMPGAYNVKAEQPQGYNVGVTGTRYQWTIAWNYTAGGGQLAVPAISNSTQPVVNLGSVTAVPVGGPGVLTATFMYSGNGVSQPLDHAYIYLQDIAAPFPMMERYFRRAKYIFGPSDANGNISVNVPAGSYRVRMIRRAPLGSAPRNIYGPPRQGDYTWASIGSEITVTPGAATSMGVMYAKVFPQSSVTTISGWVGRSSPVCAQMHYCTQTYTRTYRQGRVRRTFCSQYSQPQDCGAAGTGCQSQWQQPFASCVQWGQQGSPLAGWAVKVAAAPCTSGTRATRGNNAGCGGDLYVARTDANGNFTVGVPVPGAYYIYAEPNLGPLGSDVPGGRRSGGRGIGDSYPGNPVNVTSNGITGVNFVNPR